MLILLNKCDTVSVRNRCKADILILPGSCESWQRITFENSSSQFPESNRIGSSKNRRILVNLRASPRAVAELDQTSSVALNNMHIKLT